MEIIGYLVIGIIAGGVSGWFVGVRSVDGCLPTLAVGLIGGVVGGWLSRELGVGDAQGFIGATVIAIIGAVLVRIVLRAIETRG